VTEYYLDASALVKRYADEAGSDWVRRITELDAGNTVMVAEVTLVEVAAALAAKQRATDGITLEERNRALSRFLQDCDEGFLILPVDRLVVDRSVELTQNHRLRGYDAIQLASALIVADLLTSQSLQPPHFVVGDRNLLAAATAECLPTENPLDH